MIFKERISNDEIDVNVDGEKGIDSEKCGLSENPPCKTIKKAVEYCKPKRTISIYCAQSSNSYDSEPITFGGCRVELKNRYGLIFPITTALDEKKVKNGECLFNVKGNGQIYLDRAFIYVDTKRESGRNQGFIVLEGVESVFRLSFSNISNTTPENELYCVLIECYFGELIFQYDYISHFVSYNALILAEASETVYANNITLDSITTKSDTQSVVTIIDGCSSTEFTMCKFTNCWSTNHKLGGAIYLEIKNCKDFCSFSRCNFSNCSCKSANENTNKRNERQNDESKGGALFIQVANDAAESLDLKIDGLSISGCAAEKGEYIYMSFPAGREQINEDQFIFEMEGIYYKPNYILLEDRREGRIIDVMVDKENILPYRSENIYVGGESAIDDKTCGRKEEPCDLISTSTKHNLRFNILKLNIIKRVPVDEPLVDFQYVTVSSSSDAFSIPLTATDPSRGTLRIGANMEAGKSIAVFGEINTFLRFQHIDIEYPDAVEGDALNIFGGGYSLSLIDVILRPWSTDLCGENVIGGEGKLLPYKLIKCYNFDADFSQLVIYGRNGNITKKCQHTSDEDSKRSSAMEGCFKEERIDRMNEEENKLCSWDSGLIFLESVRGLDIKDSSFIGISDGVILTFFSTICLINSSFINNHPIDAGWENFPSLHHNIINRMRGGNGNFIELQSLSVGSDGLDGKPFGLLSADRVVGTAAENMDSYFFTPILKNVTLKREETNNKNELQSKNENEKDIEAVIHGSYLFPCELTFEAAKKKKRTEITWTNCPVIEYTNETEMKVRIPSSLLDVDDYTSVICRLTYSSGIENGEKKHTANVILVKQKKDDPKGNDPTKLTKAQLVAIVVSVSAFAVVAVVVVIVMILCLVRFKKRRQYSEIKEEKI
ncbi:uncharacterized protein MONOS_12141 [Monocercomonoides exilis]|uniref:uncharacterized protein n=1 Tax=Monocercomonoides exilis TaxID=2049356 RepID=UPI003559AA8D|nr:hypothetical protein MONOS_12141 [Monocercomonoides exilis]|eukprot:MONOS_12141.1-p1 / transcript=MONOS_12141.1 / gene=MONOS_12141 / organism=Monocercomonoides_exilis_PA203 / gene_product=unspecified product / transcript_product=unspecified product / location=Mono_scaffold00651:28290-30959(+) / protein_length=890 / sequence_SO=supercontig / SO=protein_coding / is_pseudo=false